MAAVKLGRRGTSNNQARPEFALRKLPRTGSRNAGFGSGWGRVGLQLLLDRVHQRPVDLNPEPRFQRRKELIGSFCLFHFCDMATEGIVGRDEKANKSESGPNLADDSGLRAVALSSRQIRATPLLRRVTVESRELHGRIGDLLDRLSHSRCLLP